MPASLVSVPRRRYHIGVLNTCLSFVARDLGFAETPTGAVVVSALLVGAALGSLAAGGLADRLGPRTASVVNNLPLFLGVAFSAASERLWSMLLGERPSARGRPTGGRSAHAHSRFCAADPQPRLTSAQPQHTNNVPSLPACAGRFFAGLGAGAASVYVPRYLIEIAPDEIRGGLGTLNQVGGEGLH